MEKIEHTTIDKSEWDEGPWKHEPDKVQWTDEATGLPCLIVRSPLGALCGYVGVPETHPLFGKEYDDVNLDVHGGLTFSDRCQEGAEEHGICHVPGPGEPDSVWWFGFDCAHLSDYSPGPETKLMPSLRMGQRTYRDRAYVEEECAKLAAQLVPVMLP